MKNITKLVNSQELFLQKKIYRCSVKRGQYNLAQNKINNLNTKMYYEFNVSSLNQTRIFKKIKFKNLKPLFVVGRPIKGMQKGGEKKNILNPRTSYVRPKSSYRLQVELIRLFGTYLKNIVGQKSRCKFFINSFLIKKKLPYKKLNMIKLMNKQIHNYKSLLKYNKKRKNNPRSRLNKFSIFGKNYNFVNNLNFYRSKTLKPRLNTKKISNISASYSIF